jgi:hypothetical protein
MQGPSAAEVDAALSHEENLGGFCAPSDDASDEELLEAVLKAEARELSAPKAPENPEVLCSEDIVTKRPLSSTPSSASPGGCSADDAQRATDAPSKRLCSEIDMAHHPRASPSTTGLQPDSEDMLGGFTVDEEHPMPCGYTVSSSADANLLRRCAIEEDPIEDFQSARKHADVHSLMVDIPEDQ